MLMLKYKLKSMKAKNLKQVFILGLGMIMTAGLSSCGSSEKVVSTKAQGEELIEVYCTGSEYGNYY